MEVTPAELTELCERRCQLCEKSGGDASGMPSAGIEEIIDAILVFCDNCKGCELHSAPKAPCSCHLPGARDIAYAHKHEERILHER